VRPLLGEEGKSPSEISRKDEILEGTGGVLSMAGGNLDCTFTEFQQRLEEKGLGESDAERLTRLYGSEATEILASGGDLRAEVEFAVLCEGALTLEDYWVRRSARARFDVAGGVNCLVPAAAVMAELLNWPKEESDRQVRACLATRELEMAAVRKSERHAQ
jgi:glycerol-3-phosphate dehydrogenase